MYTILHQLERNTIPFETIVGYKCYVTSTMFGVVKLKVWAGNVICVAKLAILIHIFMTINITFVPLLRRSSNSAGAVLYFSCASWST